MAKQTIYINGKRLRLDQSQLIQSGGEGMIFRCQGTAVKLYHQPTSQHQAKIQHFLLYDLAAKMSPAVLTPCHEVLDDQGIFIGFQMPLLPPNSQAVKRLSNPIFSGKHNFSPEKTIPLLQQVHTILNQLHQINITVGYLNDTNIFFSQTTHSQSNPVLHSSSSHILTPSFVDVDSYQFAGYPCPVAMPAFLDPNLFGVSDFGTGSFFSEQTDWYAFAVLLVKILLCVHPYGGTHPRYKSLRARAAANVSILDTAVTYPQNARSLDALSDDLLHYLHRVFDLGERPCFPAALVANALRGSVIGNRHPVFGKQLQRPPDLNAAKETPQELRKLYTTSGFIELVAITPHGRIQSVVFAQGRYKLVRLGIGGRLDEMVLFEGCAGYRFGLFGSYLTVNPPERQQLLILDVSGSRPQQVSLIETAAFQGTAVFAATPQHLYRIAGNWIMRGSVQQGHYVEETIGAAHKSQTWFRASPYSDTIAGYHRIFAENRYFLHSAQGTFDLQLPPLAAHEFITDSRFAFGRDTLALGVKLKENGRLQHHLHIFTHTGHLINSQPGDEETFLRLLSHCPIPQLPEDMLNTAVIYQHPAGLLIQEPSRLLFMGRT